MSEEVKNEQSEPDVAATEETRGAEDKRPGSERLTVVGIGASAGGLAALQGFFDALPSDTGMAFVVVTHMAPDKESLLPEILQRHTAMPVLQVGDLTAIEPDQVYVIPPGQHIRRLSSFAVAFFSQPNHFAIVSFMMAPHQGDPSP